MTQVRDALPYQIVCFFEHCSKGEEGGVKPMFKKFCCKFGIILEAIWQYKIDIKRSSGGRKLSQIEGKIVTIFLVNWTFFPKDLRTILMHLSRQAFTHFLIVL